MNALPSVSGFLPVLRPMAGSAWKGVDSQRVLEVLMVNLDGMVFRCAIDALWILLFVSDGCRQLTVYRADELTGKRTISLAELTHPEDRQRVREVIDQACRNDSRYRVQHRIRTREGAEKRVLERGTPVQDEQGVWVLEGFIEDITEQLLGSVSWPMPSGATAASSRIPRWAGSRLPSMATIWPPTRPWPGSTATIVPPG